MNGVLQLFTRPFHWVKKAAERNFEQKCKASKVRLSDGRNAASERQLLIAHSLEIVFNYQKTMRNTWPGIVIRKLDYTRIFVVE